MRCASRCIYAEHAQCLQPLHVNHGVPSVVVCHGGHVCTRRAGSERTRWIRQCHRSWSSMEDRGSWEAASEYTVSSLGQSSSPVCCIVTPVSRPTTAGVTWYQPSLHTQHCRPRTDHRRTTMTSEQDDASLGYNIFSIGPSTKGRSGTAPALLVDDLERILRARNTRPSNSDLADSTRTAQDSQDNFLISAGSTTRRLVRDELEALFRTIQRHHIATTRSGDDQ